MKANNHLGAGGAGTARASAPGMMILAWAAVGLPLLWGVAQTLRKALALFG